MTEIPPKISVIVPTFRDGELAEKNLKELRNVPGIEVIVIDAEKAGRANRAFQMNVGASASGGQAETLVFLHADTRIDPQDLWIVHRALKECPALAGGAFRFALDAESWKARVVEFGVRLREWVFRLPYGDQALFIRRDLLEEIGGYPEVPILEDVLLVREMRKRGKLLFYPRPAVTSARRWEKQGYLKTTFVNWATMILWRMGVSLKTLAVFRHRIFSGGVHASRGCSVSGGPEPESN